MLLFSSNNRRLRAAFATPWLRAVMWAAVVLGGMGLPESGAQERTPQGQTKPEARAKATALSVQNVVELRRRVGETVAVRGYIARTGKSQASGHQFLNFDGSELTAICFADDVKNFPDRSPAERYRDRHVQLSGKLELYRGKLQIKLCTPAQIQILEADASNQSSKLEPVTLKPIGKDAWLSPAGLRYAGRDPAGRTRLEHVQRHMRDLPERDGPHGVFEGSEGEALAVIDEAWRMIQKRGVRPQVESGRAAYTVSLGRRIGYLGGREGARRNRPPLSRVLIVVEEGTSNLVTAFPK